MNTELHKRLEEAVDNFIGYPYEVEEGLNITCQRKAFKYGAELGYKEAIKIAKEWILNNANDYESAFTGAVFHQQLADGYEACQNDFINLLK